MTTMKTELTLTNWTPRTLLPHLSRAGLQTQKPILLGTTTIIPPDTPDFAGKPAYKQPKIGIESYIISWQLSYYNS